MLWILYEFVMRLIAMIASAAGLFSKKLALRNHGLNHQKIPQLRESIWIHAASLGEFEQGKSIIDGLRRQYPDRIMVLTFFSSSGFEKRKDYPAVDHVFYLPYDRFRSMQKFVDRINPDLVIIIKYEFWFNWLRIMKQRGISYMFISALFRPDQFFFKNGFTKIRTLLQDAERIFVQNEPSARLLSRFHFQNVTVAGDTRVDRTIEITQEDFRSLVIERWLRDRFCVIAGSSWPPEEKWLAQCYDLFPDWRWIIAPHEVHSSHIFDIKKLFGEDALTLTEAEKILDEGRSIDDVPVLIIDRIGLLSRLYRYGNIALIGGGMGAGIHNTLEPAAYGLPVIFGKKYKKFQEAVDFIEVGAAQSIGSENELVAALRFLSPAEVRENIRSQLKHYFEKQSGATNLILQQIKNIL